MTRNRIDPCRQCGQRQARCRGLCAPCDRKSPHGQRAGAGAPEECDDKLFVKPTDDGRFGVFRGAHNEASFFEPVLIEAHDTDGQAEQAARAMLRRRDPVTAEERLEEWRRGHRKAWAA